MSRPAPRIWCLLGAVLAVLVGCLAAVPVPAGAGTPVRKAVHVTVQAVDSAPVALAMAPADRGPSCTPDDPDRGRVPAVPQRASGDHGYPPVARCAAEQDRQAWGTPVRAPARGPDRAAPGPLEMSVMRV
ncbi:hypothetical protein [Streptomyces sp. NBC_00536]|uniref:hypothetical protein n=1 Tax=Streptomyces sp. NBC_00536 TaxID=2975769 RepID=UPI002E8123FC|nr:hypothetical protein [Streptomyces sp. NBC_00536]